MSGILVSLIVTILLFPAIAFAQSITFDDLIKREGIWYKKFTDTPINAEITGPPPGQKEFISEFLSIEIDTVRGKIVDGKIVGTWKVYRSNGKLAAKFNIHNNQLEGVFIAYHENDILAYRINFKNGIYDGPSIGNFEDGSLRFKGTLKNGNYDGEIIQYYPNGGLMFNCELINDLPIDECIIYHPDTQKKWVKVLGDESFDCFFCNKSHAAYQLINQILLISAPFDLQAFTSLIQSQVEDNWVKPLGPGHGGTIIEVRVTFKPNGEIVKIIPAREYTREYTNDEGKLILKATDNNDVIMANLNDNVKLALHASSPIKGLKKFIGSYNKWKDIKFRFVIPN